MGLRAVWGLNYMLNVLGKPTRYLMCYSLLIDVPEVNLPSGHSRAVTACVQVYMGILMEVTSVGNISSDSY